MASRDRLVVLALVALLVLGGGFLLVASGALYLFVEPSPGNYGTATVTLVDANGTNLATVRVRVADTAEKRYVGLSRTDSLPEGEGMLFVHPDEGTQTYVMRNMSFPLDMIFVDASGTVTRIHHAPVPPPGTSGSELTRYSGRAKYVLEVPRGYANATGLDADDHVELPARV